MPFRPGIYRTGAVEKGGAYVPRFHSCGKCGKKFEENEKIWKRFRSPEGRNIVLVCYLCVKCYEGLYIDV